MFVCPILLLVCAVACHPTAEIGMGDDWSYVRTAQVLAETGHIHYNGWATTMLGWQLFPAALVFHLFGASYLGARLTTLVIAAATLAVMERCFERCGLKARNAVFATLMIGLSPLFLPLAVSYMSDVYGLFTILVCFYCCLRALRADHSRAMGWLWAGALGNAVGGTARQIAWLGVLVMIPCTLWLLRRDRRVLIVGFAANCVGVALVFASLHWFATQPYAVPETFLEAHLGVGALVHAGLNFGRLLLELGMLALPLLIAFLPVLGETRRRQVFAGVLSVAFLVAAFSLRHHHLKLERFLVPTLQDGGNYVASQGMYTVVPVYGIRPVLLTQPIQVLLTAMVICGLAAVPLCWLMGRAKTRVTVSAGELGWHELLTLVGPFSVSYLCLLAPRAAFYYPFDRYGLPLLVCAAVVCARLYQERLHANLPWVVAILIGIMAVYSVAVTHDTFALYRGTLEAVQQLKRAGVPQEAIFAGWEFSGFTQITQAGFVHDPRLRIPDATKADPTLQARPCPYPFGKLFPVMKPQYALAFSPELCGGPSTFSPVHVQMWLPREPRAIYIVRDSPRQ